LSANHVAPTSGAIGGIPIARHFARPVGCRARQERVERHNFSELLVPIIPTRGICLVLASIDIFIRTGRSAAP
jgi:hypothetical protein